MVSSPTTRTDVEYQQGDDHPLVFPVLVSGVAVNVTGWAAKSQVRNGDGELLRTWSTADGSAVCDAEGISLLMDDSLAWEWTFGYYDVAATSPAGVRVVPTWGKFVMRTARTR